MQKIIMETRLMFRVILKRIKFMVLNMYCSFFPMQDEIILESFPDFSCNTYELYRYMIRRKINSNYKITWLISEEDERKSKNTNEDYIYIYPKTFLKKLRLYKQCNRARILITSNRHVSRRKTSRRQLNIYLDHGSQLKSLLTNTGKRKPLSCDYLICQSEFFVPYQIEQYTLSQKQVICTGLPRDDQLFRHYNSIANLIPDRQKYKKVIIWVPTFRQHKNKVRIDCKHRYPLGLPILNSSNDAFVLNEVLIKTQTLLLIKPHPAQNMDVIHSFGLSNISFIYNSDLDKYNIQTNELLAQTDAMITDYSSIYYDYLLLHQPIAITLDDFEDYNRDKGFVFKNPLDVLKGAYIYSFADMCEFIEDTANGMDRAKEEREKICDLVHTYQDANSTERVYNFIFTHKKICNVK